MFECACLDFLVLGALPWAAVFKCTQTPAVCFAIHLAEFTHSACLNVFLLWYFLKSYPIHSQFKKDEFFWIKLASISQKSFLGIPWTAEAHLKTSWEGCTVWKQLCVVTFSMVEMVTCPGASWFSEIQFLRAISSHSACILSQNSVSD